MLHYTAMTSPQAALERLCSDHFNVSAHYLIAANGTCFQLVAEDKRAWHAGDGEWQGRDDINSRSIGIELDNSGDEPFSEPQMSCLEGLLRCILKRHNLHPASVIAHSDFALGRKTDPGPKFNWQRLAELNLSVWPRDTGHCMIDAAQFAVDAARFGYPMIDPHATPDRFRLLLQAFRLRFAPWRQGPLTESDMATVAALAAHDTA